MMTDNEIKRVGFDALGKALGIVEAERFITLILREPRDYTKWRREHLFPGMSVAELVEETQKFEEKRSEAESR